MQIKQLLQKEYKQFDEFLNEIIKQDDIEFIYLYQYIQYITKQNITVLRLNEKSSISQEQQKKDIELQKQQKKLIDVNLKVFQVLLELLDFDQKVKYQKIIDEFQDNMEKDGLIKAIQLLFKSENNMELINKKSKKGILADILKRYQIPQDVVLKEEKPKVPRAKKATTENKVEKKQEEKTVSTAVVPLKRNRNIIPTKVEQPKVQEQEQEQKVEEPKQNIDFEGDNEMSKE